jgi:hypothetical protein
MVGNWPIVCSGFCADKAIGTNFANVPNSTTDAWDFSDDEWIDDVIGLPGTLKCGRDCIVENRG